MVILHKIYFTAKVIATMQEVKHKITPPEEENFAVITKINESKDYVHVYYHTNLDKKRWASKVFFSKDFIEQSGQTVMYFFYKHIQAILYHRSL